MALALALSGVIAQPGAARAQDPGPISEDSVGVIEAPDSVRDAFDANTHTERASDVDNSFNLAPKRMPRQANASTQAVMIAVPVVVELFTAQGCSTCPAADQMIALLADQPDVLTLSWHVDYWDYLGWPDGFARPGHTLRQEAYAAVAGERGVYTPQIIVDGQDTLIGVGQAGLLALVDEHASRPPEVMVTAVPGKDGAVVDLTPRTAVPGGVALTMISYLPRRAVTVGAGENEGETIVYRNIVVGTEQLSRWTARAPLRLTVRSSTRNDAGYPDDTRHALLIQQILSGDRPGPILAALRLD